MGRPSNINTGKRNAQALIYALASSTCMFSSAFIGVASAQELQGGTPLIGTPLPGVNINPIQVPEVEDYATFQARMNQLMYANITRPTNTVPKAGMQPTMVPYSCSVSSSPCTMEVQGNMGAGSPKAGSVGAVAPVAGVGAGRLFVRHSVPAAPVAGTGDESEPEPEVTVVVSTTTPAPTSPPVSIP